MKGSENLKHRLFWLQIDDFLLWRKVSIAFKQEKIYNFCAFFMPEIIEMNIFIDFPITEAAMKVKQGVLYI